LSDQYRNLPLELKVISYIVRKNYKLCDDINRDIFSIKAYRLFFDIISSERTTHPKEVLKDKISERVKKPQIFNPYLIRVYKTNIESVTHKSAKAMISKLTKLSNLRISLEKTEELVLEVRDGNMDKVRKIAKQISLLGPNRKRNNAGDYLKDFEERKSIIESRRSKKLVGVPTGIKRFDDLTGGVLKGELAILAGESGIGKSIGLENIGISAWDLGMNVMYVSVEMPKTNVQFRMDSRLTRLLYKKFRIGDFTDKDIVRWEKIIEEYRVNKKNYYHVVSLPRGCSAFDVEIEAEKVQDIYGKKLDIIITDYLNIMKPNSSKYGSPRDWKNQTDIAWEHKEVATDFCDEGIVVWTGNQIVDEGEGQKVIKKKHIKYGRGIVEVANIVVALVQTVDDALENIMKLQFVKVRDLEKMDPIVIRPNYDIMALNDEMRIPGRRSLKERRKFK